MDRRGQGQELSAPSDATFLCDCKLILTQRKELQRFFRRPTVEPFLSKNYRDFKASSLGILVFRGTFRPI